MAPDGDATHPANNRTHRPQSSEIETSPSDLGDEDEEEAVPSHSPEPADPVLDERFTIQVHSIDMALGWLFAVSSPEAIAIASNMMAEMIIQGHVPHPGLVGNILHSSMAILPPPSEDHRHAPAVIRNDVDGWNVNLFDPAADVVGPRAQEMVNSFFRYHLLEIKGLLKRVLISCPPFLRPADRVVYAFAIALHGVVSVPLPQNLPVRLWQFVLVSVLNVNVRAMGWKEFMPSTSVIPQPPRMDDHFPGTMTIEQEISEYIRITNECRRWHEGIRMQIQRTIVGMQRLAANVTSVSAVITRVLQDSSICAQREGSPESHTEDGFEYTTSMRERLQGANAHLGLLHLQLVVKTWDYNRIVGELNGTRLR